MLYLDFLNKNRNEIKKRKNVSYIMSFLYVLFVVVFVITVSRQNKFLFTFLFAVISLIYTTVLFAYCYTEIKNNRKVIYNVEKLLSSKHSVSTFTFVEFLGITTEDDATIAFGYKFLDQYNKEINFYSYLNLDFLKDDLYILTTNNDMILEVGE